jgi:poly-gamma-glutamate capsule biosynthesis protein CapA/YwtB (metallophosphatase superfamily)
MLLAAAPPAPVPHPVVLRIVASGDFLIHQPVWERALRDGNGSYDFRPMLRLIRPIVRRADLALCHVETPMQSGPPMGYPVFRTPPALARSIRWGGYDACDTASNHSLDRGQAGIDSTSAALDAAHVHHTGSFRSPQAHRHLLILRVRGVKVAFLAYTALTNGFSPPHPWSLNLASAGRVIRDAKRARREGARVVIVNFHWGDEFVSRPSAAQVSLARALARSHQVTAVVGQHVHVVQPIRTIRGMPVVYGEGNLVSNQTSACCPAASQDGIIARLKITVPSSGRARATASYTATWVRHPDFTVVPISPRTRNAQLLASLRRTRAAVR